MLDVPLGRAIAQVGSRRLATATALVRFQVRAYRICCQQNGTGAGFLQLLRFPCKILIPPTDPLSSSLLSPTGAGTIGPLVACLPSGISLTVPQQ
jgi:hypothetical protein